MSSKKANSQNIPLIYMERHEQISTLYGYFLENQRSLCNKQLQLTEYDLLRINNKNVGIACFFTNRVLPNRDFLRVFQSHQAYSDEGFFALLAAQTKRDANLLAEQTDEEEALYKLQATSLSQPKSTIEASPLPSIEDTESRTSSRSSSPSFWAPPPLPQEQNTNSADNSTKHSTADSWEDWTDEALNSLSLGGSSSV
jgi:hypothetical protein